MHEIRERLIFKLCRTFDNDEIQIILDQVESILMDYTVKPKSTLPIVWNDDTYIIKYFEAKQVEGVSAETIKTYKSELRDFMANIHKPLREMTTQDIMDYFVDLRRRRNVTDANLDHRRTVIKNLFQWMYENDHIQKNPCLGIKRIKYQKGCRQPLSSRELEQIRYACRNNPRNAALVEFMYSTGCRINEVRNIKITDIDFYNKEVKVIGKGNKERTVFINAQAENAIKRYLETRKNKSEYLFAHTRNMGNRPMDTDTIRKVFKDISKAAGLDRVLKPHEMRHTTATDALQKGMPIEEVQMLLGHSRIDTTMIYAKVDTSRLKLDHKKCFS